MPQVIWEFYTDEFPYPLPMLVQALGDLKYMIVPGDPRPATEQLNERYQGGWDPHPGFSLIGGVALKFPGDPLMHPYARLEVHGDTVLVYSYSWVCVVHADRTFEVARLD